VNSIVWVCSCQVTADFAYVETPVPSTHLYVTCGSCVFDFAGFLVENEFVNVVVMIVWSDKPFNVSGSHSIVAVGVLDRIRSMHELSVPLWNVLHAMGPGCIPLSICKPYSSHISISHGALMFVYLSLLLRGILVSSMLGDNSPTRVFQSPQMIYFSLCGNASSMSCIRLLVSSSSTPLRCRFGAGGM
jgi:hypothetical protein